MISYTRREVDGRARPFHIFVTQLGLLLLLVASCTGLLARQHLDGTQDADTSSGRPVDSVMVPGRDGLILLCDEG